jgi:hypothetical protein
VAFLRRLCSSHARRARPTAHHISVRVELVLTLAIVHRFKYCTHFRGSFPNNKRSCRPEEWDYRVQVLIDWHVRSFCSSTTTKSESIPTNKDRFENSDSKHLHFVKLHSRRFIPSQTLRTVPLQYTVQGDNGIYGSIGCLLCLQYFLSSHVRRKICLLTRRVCSFWWTRQAFVCLLLRAGSWIGEIIYLHASRMRNKLLEQSCCWWWCSDAKNMGVMCSWPDLMACLGCNHHLSHRAAGVSNSHTWVPMPVQLSYGSESCVANHDREWEWWIIDEAHRQKRWRTSALL